MVIKKISPLLIAFVVVITITLSYAGCVKADQAIFEVGHKDEIVLKEVCLNGRLFLVTVTGRGAGGLRGVSTIQVMLRIGRRAVTIPVLCTAIQGSSTNFITADQE